MFRKLFRDNSGGITITAALTLVPLIGMMAFAVEFGQAYDEYVKAQSAADMTALAGALTLENASGSEFSKAVMARNSAYAVANVNGGLYRTVTVYSNYQGTGQKAVEATVTRMVPLRLARIFTRSGTLPVKATAIAALVKSSSPPCIVALGGGDSITAQENTALAGANCAVNGMGDMVATSGAQISAALVKLGGGLNIWAGGTVFTTPTAGLIFTGRPNEVTDPTFAFSGEYDAALMDTHASYDIQPNPVHPSNPGDGDWRFDPNNESPEVASFRTGPTTYVVPPLPDDYLHLMDKLYVARGVTVTFKPGPGLVVNDGIVNYGQLIFEGSDSFDSTITVTGGINSTEGDGPITFGDRIDLEVAPGTVKLYGTSSFGNGGLNGGWGQIHSSAKLIIASGADVTVGDSSLTLEGGLEVAPGANLRLSPATNVLRTIWGLVVDDGGQMMVGQSQAQFAVYPGSGSNVAIKMNGSAALILEDSPFLIFGDVKMTGDDGHLVFGRSAGFQYYDTDQYIAGDLDVEGAVLFGGGLYRIRGGFTGGASSSARWPFTSHWGITYGGSAPYAGYSIVGKDVTFGVIDAIDLDNGAPINLMAPTGVWPNPNFQDILFVSKTSEPSAFGGMNSKFRGILWTPNADITLVGGNGLIDPDNDCFMLVVSKLTLTSNGATGRTCPRVASSSSSSNLQVTLIR